METQKGPSVPWWVTTNLIVGILNLLIILMLFAIMSSDFYKIFIWLFGTVTGRSVIKAFYRFGFYFAFPVGMFNLVVGIISKKLSIGRGYSNVSIAGIVFGALGTLLGGTLFAFALFFLTV